MTGLLNTSYLEDIEQDKTVMCKETTSSNSYYLGEGDIWNLEVWIMFMFCLCSNMIMGWSCFCLDPSWSQNGLV